MKIPYFCCIGAELKRYAKDFDFMNQVYLYKVPTDDTIEEVFAQDYFQPVADTVLDDDIVYIYEPTTQVLYTCHFKKQNGHITVEQMANNIPALTPNKILISDEDGKIAAGDLSLEDIVVKISTEKQIMQGGLQTPELETDDLTVNGTAEFDNAPTTNDTTTYKNATSDSLVRKEQVDEVVQDIKTSSLTFIGYVSATEPSSATYAFNTGDLWLNSATMPTTFPFPQANIKEWNGSAWVAHSQDYTPANFDFFRNVNNNEGYYWFGGEWVVMSTDMSTTYFQLNPTSGKWEIKSNVNLPGAPTTTTPSTDDNSTKIATTAFTGNAITAAKQKTISNCITECSQDIILELNNGTLTLKAGSKVYVPNGAEVFNVITIANDIVRTGSGDGTDKMLFYKNGTISSRQTVGIVSGSTPPSSSLGQYLGWYDTINNVIKLTSDGGSTWDSGWSFPFCITHDSSGAVFLDQVFNGFGYIGSSWFLLPKLTGLIPDKFNADGTLKNIKVVVNNLVVKTMIGGSNQKKITLGISATGNIVAAGSYKYIESENINTDNNIHWHSVAIAEFDNTNGKISRAVLKKTFHAVDYNDTEYMAHQAMPSDRFINLTLGASGTQYTAPADGWFSYYHNGGSTSAFYTNNGLYGYSARGDSGIVNFNTIQVKKGTTVTLVYNGSGGVQLLRFVYAEGAQ